jgi:ubiquinone/menaquinone biosynthesis C-methylase UbiE/PAS domain-containing protein
MTLYAMALVVEGKEADKQGCLDEIRSVVERLCRDVRRSGRYVLANPQSADYAHQACSRILGSARARADANGGIKWKIGIASGLPAADVTVEASRLADEAPPGHAFIAEAVHRELAPRSSARYLPSQEVAGYRACQTIPAGYRRCFVVLPMGSDGSPERSRSDCVFARVIRPACERLKYVTVHPGQQEGENVWGDISNSLMAADHVIAYLGAAPWNPNVMLEVGYRLATAKPLVVLAPAGELPFDLKNHRTIILPADPSELAEAEAEAKVAELMELTTKRVARDRGWAGLHPTATIEVDRRAGIDPELRDHRITDASERTARLFAIDRAELIGMPPAAVMERLSTLMDKTQYKAFLEEQGRLYEKLSSDDAIGAESRRTVHAEVPIVLTQHPDPEHYLRAFLPAILSNDQVGERALQRVVYVDMSRHIRRDDQGVYRVPRPAPNLDFVFAKYAGSYDKVLLALPHYCEAMNHHLALVAPRDGLKVLDLGAGTGNLAVRLLQAGATVTALDKSQDMLNVLRKKCQGFGDRLKVVRRDGCDLTGIAAASYDVVNAMLVMFAADRPQAMLREARRVLRPGGALVITEPNQKFDMETLLRESEDQLRSAGLLGPAGTPGSLLEDWDTVNKANQAFSETVQEAWKAEQMEEELREVGWEDIETTLVYNGHCTTLRATKPADS